MTTAIPYKITRPVLSRVGETSFEFVCPGCHRSHTIRASDDGVFDSARGLWQWNRSLDRPTFWPSLLVESEHGVCHSWITRGRLQVVADTTAHRERGELAMLPIEPEPD